jgi:hypothetical protein
MSILKSKRLLKMLKDGFSAAMFWDAFDNFHKHDTLVYVPVLAFVSADRKDFTIVGMNGIESDTELSIQLEGLDPAAFEKKVNYFRTGDNEKCNKVSVIIGKNNSIRAIIKPKSIFTLSTLP